MLLRFLIVNSRETTPSSSPSNSLELDVSPSTTFQDITHIIATRSLLQGCVIRLIFQGRFVNWNSTPATWPGISENSCLHLHTTVASTGVTQGLYQLYDVEQSNARENHHLLAEKHLHWAIVLIILFFLIYLWYWKWSYPKHFTSLSVFLLFLLSCVLVVDLTNKLFLYFRET